MRPQGKAKKVALPVGPGDLSKGSFVERYSARHLPWLYDNAEICIVSGWAKRLSVRAVCWCIRHDATLLEASWQSNKQETARESSASTAMGSLNIGRLHRAMVLCCLQQQILLLAPLPKAAR